MSGEICITEEAASQCARLSSLGNNGVDHGVSTCHRVTDAPTTDGIQHKGVHQRVCNTMASAHAMFGNTARATCAMGDAKGTMAQAQGCDLSVRLRSSPPVSDAEGNVV